MTNEELLVECKKSLNISLTSTAFDDVLNQKILAVKSFMFNGGVSNDIMNDDLAVGCIVLGVADLWNVESGKVKFSTVFYTLVNQLLAASSLITLTSNPTDGATDVAVTVKPVLTINRMIKSFKIRLMEYVSQLDVSYYASLDLSKKIITLAPNANLKGNTKYAIVIDNLTASTGQTLGYTVISFTTL